MKYYKGIQTIALRTKRESTEIFSDEVLENAALLRADISNTQV
jgi:hypothetical protein